MPIRHKNPSLIIYSDSEVVEKQALVHTAAGREVVRLCALLRVLLGFLRARLSGSEVGGMAGPREAVSSPTWLPTCFLPL